MNEYDRQLTLEDLPEAVLHIMQDVAVIKNHLLNEAVSPAEPSYDVPEEGILTVNDVCDKLDLKRGTVYNLTHKQEIPHFKRGGRIYFDRGEIDDWIRRDRRKTLKQLQDEADIDSRKK